MVMALARRQRLYRGIVGDQRGEAGIGHPVQQFLVAAVEGGAAVQPLLGRVPAHAQ